MELAKSIWGLVKYNNGFFKSEKQAQFLISEMILLDGHIGFADSGFNSCPIFASWDERGITKIVKSAKKGGIIMFERKKEGILTTIEINKIKIYERKIKSIEKDINECKISFDNGTYSHSGIYTTEMIERFNRFQNQKIKQIEKLQEIIDKLKNNSNG